MSDNELIKKIADQMMVIESKLVDLISNNQNSSNFTKSQRESHHEWVSARIEAEIARKKMYISITKAFIGWSIPAILTGVVYYLQTGHWPKINL